MELEYVQRPRPSASKADSTARGGLHMRIPARGGLHMRIPARGGLHMRIPSTCVVLRSHSF